MREEGFDEDNLEAPNILEPQTRILTYDEIETKFVLGFFKPYMEKWKLENLEYDNFSGYAVFSNQDPEKYINSRIIKVEEIKIGDKTEYKIIDDCPGHYANFDLEDQKGQLGELWIKLEQMAPNSEEHKAIQEYLPVIMELKLSDQPTYEEAEDFYYSYVYFSKLISKYKKMLEDNKLIKPLTEEDEILHEDSDQDYDDPNGDNVYELLCIANRKVKESKFVKDHINVGNSNITKRNLAIKNYLKKFKLSPSDRSQVIYDDNQTRYVVYKKKKSTCIIRVNEVHEPDGAVRYEIIGVKPENIVNNNTKDVATDIQKDANDPEINNKPYLKEANKEVATDNQPQTRQLSCEEIKDLDEKAFFSSYKEKWGLSGADATYNKSGFVVLCMTNDKDRVVRSRIIKVEELKVGDDKQYRIIDNYPGCYVNYDLVDHKKNMTVLWEKLKTIASDSPAHKAIQEYLPVIMKLKLSDQPTYEEAEDFYYSYFHFSNLIEKYIATLQKGIAAPPSRDNKESEAGIDNGINDQARDTAQELLNCIYTKMGESEFVQNHITIGDPNIEKRNKDIKDYLKKFGLFPENRTQVIFDDKQSIVAVYKNKDTTIAIKINKIKAPDGEVQYDIVAAEPEYHSIYNLNRVIDEIEKKAKELENDEPHSEEYDAVLKSINNLRKIKEEENITREGAEQARNFFEDCKSALDRYFYEQKSNRNNRIKLDKLYTKVTHKVNYFELLATQLNERNAVSLDGHEISASLKEMSNAEKKSDITLDNYIKYANMWYENMGSLMGSATDESNMLKMSQYEASGIEMAEQEKDALKSMIGNEMYNKFANAFMPGTDDLLQQEKSSKQSIELEEYADMLGKRVIAANVVKKLVELEKSQNVNFEHSISKIISEGKLQDVIDMVSNTKSFGEYVRPIDLGNVSESQLKDLIEAKGNEKSVPELVVADMIKNYRQSKLNTEKHKIAHANKTDKDIIKAKGDEIKPIIKNVP